MVTYPGVRDTPAIVVTYWQHLAVYTSSASQRSLHNAPIFRLLLKVAVNGTHQCDFLNFCGGLGPQPFSFRGVASAQKAGRCNTCPRAGILLATSPMATCGSYVLLRSRGVCVFLVVRFSTICSQVPFQGLLDCGMVGRSSQAYFLERNSAMDDSIGGS